MKESLFGYSPRGDVIRQRTVQQQTARAGSWLVSICYHSRRQSHQKVGRGYKLSKAHPPCPPTDLKGNQVLKYLSLWGAQRQRERGGGRDAFTFKPHSWGQPVTHPGCADEIIERQILTGNDRNISQRSEPRSQGMQAAVKAERKRRIFFF